MMYDLALLTTLTLGGLKSLTMANPIAQQITPNLNVPAGYQVGFATVSPCLSSPQSRPTPFARPRTYFPLVSSPLLPIQQDWEPYGQQSACTINGGVCSPPTPLYNSTSGPNPLPNGVYAAAMVGLGPDDCTVCGTCYSIISSGTPYCDPNGTACA